MKSNFLVVGVVANAGHGKDTCAGFLREEYSLRRQALADELKADIAAWFSDFPECSIEAQNSRDRVPWVRRLQQIYGTEICRKRFGEDYWLKRWSKAVEKFPEGTPGVVVSDVRFPNEMKYLRDHWDAKVLYIDRPGWQQPGVDPQHESEIFVRSLKPEADICIVNDGSLEDFRERVILSFGTLLKEV